MIDILTKEEKKSLNKKTFSIHEKNRDLADAFKSQILNYKHFENMLVLLLHELNEKKDYEILSLLKNRVIMKAVSQKLKGGKATRDNVKKVYDYFGDHKLFNDMIDFSKEYLNGHNVSMIVERVKTMWDNALDARNEFFKNPSNFTGCPNFPKTTKLSKVSKYSVPLERGKWSLKIEKTLGITLGKRQTKTFINSNTPYLKDKKIISVTVSLSQGHIYYKFTYGEEKSKKAKLRIVKPQKIAAGDVGVITTHALFIHDLETPSLLLDGRDLIRYNSDFNYKIAKINEEMAKEVVEYKEMTKKNGEKVKIPLEYNERGKKLRFVRSNLHEKRNRFFNDAFDKLSKKTLTYLSLNDVTDFVISTNLQNAKSTGDIKMRKAQKQEFYQIPIGRYLNKIKYKSSSFNVVVHDIDEAYTSQTSCLSADVNEIVAQRKSGKKPTPNDKKGCRGVVVPKSNNKKPHRGLFKDSLLNKIWNSDLNGSANHIKVAFPKEDLSIYKDYMFKLCNPVTIKSANDFDVFLRSNSEADRKNTLVNVESKTC